MKITLRPHALALRLIYFFYYFAFGSLFPLLALYLKDVLGLGGAQIGMLMSINPIVMIAAQPLWGLFCDYTQAPRTVLCMTVVLTALMSVALGSVHTYWLLFVLLVALAFFQSAISPIMDSITMSYATREGKAYGSFALWGAFGFGSASLLVGKLAEHWGLHIIFMSFAIVLLLCMAAAWKSPKEKPGVRNNLRQGIVILMRIPAFILFLAAAFLIFGPILANNFYFSFYVKEAGGTLTGIGISFLLAVGSEVPFMKASSKLIEKWGIVAVILTAALISGSRWLLYGFSMPLSLIYATSVLQGISVGFFIPAAMHLVYKLAPEEVKVTAISLYSMMGSGLGTCFCTFAGGLLLERYSIHTVYISFGLLTFFGVIFLLLLGRARLQNGNKIAKVKNKPS
ncbi:MFS transporter [Paenibacillus sp. GCM10027628]|uniref:MFS transporter n=1 Tax=Paenibacillus sp. GCM10027628 TaxID=3273413 RepID=UPI00363FEDD9